MLKILRLGTAVMLAVVPWANAQQASAQNSTEAGAITSIRPVDGDTFQDHLISQCGGTRGMLMMNYGTSMGITELSDFCLDEQTGSMVSSETRDGFVLAENGPQGRAFEILETGHDKYSRVRVGIGSEHVWCLPTDETQAVQYFIPDNILSRHSDAGYMLASGYTVTDVDKAEWSIASGQQAYLSFRDFSISGISQASTVATALEGADFVGKLVSQGDTATFIIESGNGYWVGAGSGHVEIALGSGGGITATGNISAENIRLVGHKPGEWIKMSANIPYMRGHLLGREGEMLNAMGVVRGSYVDFEGITHEFMASAFLSVCAEI